MNSSYLKIRDTFSRLRYNAHTVWLFTHDQVFDTVIPCTVFGVCTVFAGEHYGLPPQSVADILTRAPLIALWLWSIILVFCLHNQREPDSIKEDAINKPWRPLPAGRILVSSANILMSLACAITGIFSYALGVSPQFWMFLLNSIVYNDLGGSDHSGFTRNGLCAAAFTCLFSGALQIGLGQNVSISSEGWRWVFVVVTAFFTTVHSSEFRDEEGDKLRERRTIITAMGGKLARWTLILAILFWSMAIPIWMGVNLICGLAPVGIGIAIVGMNLRAMKIQDRAVDRRMYRLWAIWLMTFCLLPLGLFSWTGLVA